MSAERVHHEDFVVSVSTTHSENADFVLRVTPIVVFNAKALSDNGLFLSDRTDVIDNDNPLLIPIQRTEDLRNTSQKRARMQLRPEMLGKNN